MFMTYGSVCSGIEAASVALEPLGLVPVWFSEIEPFPCAVLSHHWPHVPNLGDMTKIAARIASGEIGGPDILVGGTPCQAFSVAGMRQGLSDDRGALTIKFVEIADEIDKQRGVGNECVVWWENVPGVLNSKDNAFGCFLGALAGEECELQPPGGKWANAGCVYGPKRAIAWRVLDAQYFGVAQRRRRVFVVASAREGFDPTEILFECEGVRRDTPPSREAGKAVAALTANGVGTCGADDNQGQAGHLIPLGTSTWPVSHCLNAGGMGRIDYETETMVVHGTQDPDTNVELAHTIGRNQGQKNAVAYGARTANTSSNGWGIQEEVTHTLDTTQGIAVAAPAIALQTDVTPKASEELAFTLKLPSSSGGGQPAAAMTPDLAVRRLTPIECERLQGFPDGHTDVPYRGKPASDGPRYKAIGNSMAVPCMRWIGERLMAR